MDEDDDDEALRHGGEPVDDAVAAGLRGGQVEDDHEAEEGGDEDAGEHAVEEDHLGLVLPADEAARVGAVVLAGSTDNAFLGEPRAFFGSKSVWKDTFMGVAVVKDTFSLCHLDL